MQKIFYKYIIMDTGIFEQDPQFETDSALGIYDPHEDFAQITMTERNHSQPYDIRTWQTHINSLFLSEQLNTSNFYKRSKRRYLGALKLFFFESKRKNGSVVPKSPKKEYLRTKLFRGHKRATRQSISNKIPKKTLHFISNASISQKDAWDTFCKFNINHREVMIGVSTTESGPRTDGQTWKSMRSYQTGTESKTEKTFNDNFCSKYLSNDMVVKSFLLYVDCLFADMDSSVLCSRFRFKCCENEHNAECIQHWQELREQLKNEFIQVQINPH